MFSSSHVLLLRHSFFEEAYVQLVACLQEGLSGEAGRLTKAPRAFLISTNHQTL